MFVGFSKMDDCLTNLKSTTTYTHMQVCSQILRYQPGKKMTGMAGKIDDSYRLFLLSCDDKFFGIFTQQLFKKKILSDEDDVRKEKKKKIDIEIATQEKNEKNKIKALKLEWQKERDETQNKENVDANIDVQQSNDGKLHKERDETENKENLDANVDGQQNSGAKRKFGDGELEQDVPEYVAQKKKKTQPKPQIRKRKSIPRNEGNYRGMGIRRRLKKQLI